VKRVHLIGIGGAGMSAVAKVLLERGVEVSGSDLKRSRALAMLEALGARVHVGHSAEQVEGAGTVVVSAAIPSTNPELVRARALGLEVITRGEALARLLQPCRALVVAGTHGKTTTTSMAVAVARAGGLDPTYLVGGGLNDSGTNARAGSDVLAIAESDESDGSFLLLEPDIAVVTNLEIDHVDHWGSLEELYRAFERFVARVRPGGTAVLPAGDDRLAAAAAADVITFGENGMVRAAGAESSFRGASFTLVTPEGEAEVTLRVPGLHNVSNALAAAAAGLAAGVDLAAVARGLSTYRGVERRLQLRGRAGGVLLIDDYAHHPTEVRATLAAARPGPFRRLVAVFQPHRYTRTAAFAADFGTAFAGADVVVITDVYGAGEQPVPGVTGKLVADAVCRALPGRPVAYLPHRKELVDYLSGALRPGDAVITLGAGDVSTLADELLERLGQGG
jgi:UDP-N-acetylmuramate--alanine ligase